MNKLDRFEVGNNMDPEKLKLLNNKFSTYVLDFCYKYFYEFEFVARVSK